MSRDDVSYIQFIYEGTEHCMQSELCTQVQAWIQQSGDLIDPGLPPDELCEHIPGCTVCRSRLAVLLAALLDVPGLSAASSCEQCQHDLPEYIDIEHAQGTKAAAHTYPHVWWHLLTCPDCAETYAWTTKLLAAEEAGELEPVPLEWATRSIVSRVLGTFSVSRTTLSQVFSLRRSLGVAWGDDDEELVLIDDEVAGHQITLSVQPQIDHSWSVNVTLAPPLAGEVILTLGSNTFAVPIESTGSVYIPHVAGALIHADDGPDLTVTIKAAW
ncbi:MAG TPA: hypothetical protein VGD58_00345 [Herpetosiphonaceae bacterium]